MPPLRASSLLILAFPLLLTACDKPQAPAQGTTEVGYVELHGEPLTLSEELSGRITAARSAEVRPQVDGIIESRNFVEGSTVRAGQVLYHIDAASYQASFDEARAALANAQAAVETARLKSERYQRLLKNQGVAQQDADDALATYRQAVATVEQDKAALASARINLQRTQIKAPITGRIGISSVTEGTLVTASQDTALATIRSLDPIYLDLTQSSTQLLRLRKELAARGVSDAPNSLHLTLEDGSAYTHPGELKLTEVAVDESTGSVTLRAEFPNPEGVLLPGMYVRANLDRAQLQDAILAPQQGIAHDAKGKATAMVLSKDDKVETRDVVADKAIGERWLISSGLQDGDRLIVEGISKVRAGQQVKATAVDLTQKSGTAKAGTATAQQEH